MPKHLRRRPAFLCVCALAAATLAAPSALAQPDDDAGEPPVAVEDSAAPEWARRLGIRPTPEQARQYEEQRKTREEIEKELRRIRQRHFVQNGNQVTRDEGIQKVRELAQPSVFPLLIDLYAREKDDVRFAMLQIFADSATPQGDAALTWQAVFAPARTVRERSTLLLRSRLASGGKPAGDQVRFVLYEALRSRNARTMASAAGVTEQLQLFDLVPWLAAAQVQRAPASGAGSGPALRRRGALAWIFVGTQTTYVADLEPVVAEGAVAFDPQLAVATSGTVLRVLDASVYTYHIEVHNALVRMTSRAWGQSTTTLGFDYTKWKDWYEGEFRPFLARRERERAAQAAAQGQPPQPQTTQQPAPQPATLPQPTTDPAPADFTPLPRRRG